MLTACIHIGIGSTQILNTSEAEGPSETAESSTANQTNNRYPRSGLSFFWIVKLFLLRDLSICLILTYLSTVFTGPDDPDQSTTPTAFHEENYQENSQLAVNQGNEQFGRFFSC